MLAFKVAEVISPIMGEDRGFRMKLAAMNSAGPKGKPSFRAGYLYAVSGDFTQCPLPREQDAWIKSMALGESVVKV